MRGHARSRRSVGAFSAQSSLAVRRKFFGPQTPFPSSASKMTKRTLTVRMFAITGFLLGPLALDQARAASSIETYSCSGGRDLRIRRSTLGAHVSLEGKSYELRRHRSSIGEKYLSSKEALIIDGSSAVFVTNNHLDLGTCEEVLPVASAN